MYGFVIAGISLLLRCTDSNIVNNNKLNYYSALSRRLLTNYEYWTTATSTLPRADARAAIGHYNQSIFILGGTNYRFQLTEYNIVNDKFIDYGTSVLGDHTYGSGQFYTQINNILYIINVGGASLSTFDTTTKIFTPNYNDVTIPIAVDTTSCLASTNDGSYLFVVGGGPNSSPLTSLQIFNMQSNTWLSNTPAMQTQRSKFSCIVHPTKNELYAIGGINGTNVPWLNSVEVLNVNHASLNNIEFQTWRYIDDNLLHPISASRAVMVGNDILVIGGGNSDGYVDDIQIINAITYQISSGGFMNYAIMEETVIVVDNTIYIFGGYNGNIHNTWQYSIFTNPTIEPTIMPSMQPTFLPFATTNPTENPTENPSSTENTVSNTNITMMQTVKSDTDNVVIIVLVIVIVAILFMGVLAYVVYKTKSKSIRTANVYHASREKNENIINISNNKPTVGLQPMEYKNIDPSAPILTMDDDKKQEIETKGSFPKYKNIEPLVPNYVDNVDMDVNDQYNKQLISDIAGEGEGQINDKYKPIKEWLYNALDGDMDDVDQYLPLLIDNGFDSLSILKTVTNDELLNIGITKLGHRKKLLFCVQKNA
eukprot:426577_1